MILKWLNAIRKRLVPETSFGERKNDGSVMIWGITLVWFGSIYPLNLESIAGNQYEVPLTDRLYSIMKRFYPDGSGVLHRTPTE